MFTAVKNPFNLTLVKNISHNFHNIFFFIPAVLLALILCIIIAVGIILFIRHRRSQTKGYGQLTSETHLDDVTPVVREVGATTAALDAESDEECMRYSKGDEEKEFLV